MTSETSEINLALLDLVFNKVLHFSRFEQSGEEKSCADWLESARTIDRAHALQSPPPPHPQTSARISAFGPEIIEIEICKVTAAQPSFKI